MMDLYQAMFFWRQFKFYELKIGMYNIIMYICFVKLCDKKSIEK